jgi:4-alpha-glucanotransferase
LLTNIVWAPCATLAEALERAADEFRVVAEYTDNWGEVRETKPEVRAAVLRSLGVPVDSLPALNDFLRDRLLAEWSRLLPETLVTGPTPPSGTPAICVPADTDENARLRLRIRLESGEVEQGDWRLGDLEWIGEATVGERRFHRRALQFKPPVPLGYHELWGALDAEPSDGVVTRWIVGPDRAYQAEEAPARMGGLAISLYGLRSSRNWGVGDFTDLAGMADWAARDLGVALIGLNPLHAIHNRQPFNTSPYLPLSAFFRNPLYLDIDAVPEMAGSERAQLLRRLPCVTRELAALRDAEFVEYERAWRIKRLFLRALFRQMEREQGERRERFEAYCADPLLRQFATYCALDPEMHRRDRNAWSWPQWPAEFHRPGNEAVAKTASVREVRFHSYLQFLIDEQLAAAQQACREAGMAIGLYHDLALATDRGGCDTWMMPELFVQGCRVGSPPDGFSPEGQDWSFPPPDDAAHARNGYQAFRELIRRNARHGGALRFDHVMRFFRLFWIPDGFAAREGVYVHSNAEALMRVLALESHRGRFLVIGEDLGTVTGEIRQMLDQFGILGYRLLYFERDGDEYRGADTYPRQSVAAITTHDLPTLAGFWQSADIEARRAAHLVSQASYEEQLRARKGDIEALDELLGEPESRAIAALGFLAQTPSRILMINQEELTDEPLQQNLPGSTAEYPNWRRKMRVKVERLRKEFTFAERTALVRGLIRRRENA